MNVARAAIRGAFSVAFGLVILSSSGCKSKSSGGLDENKPAADVTTNKNAAGSTGATTGSTAATGDTKEADGALCDRMKGKTDFYGQWKTETDSMCEKITMLRGSDKVYVGGGSPIVTKDKEQRVGTTADVSRVVLFSSIKEKNEPRFFFSKVRMEVSDPPQFKAKGFRMTPDEAAIDFAVLEKTKAFTRYHYTNNSEVGVPIEYNGRESFYEIEKDKTYVVVSKAEDYIQSIKEFIGLIVINKIGTSDTIEVFAMAQEAYNNYGNHDKVVSRLVTKFGLEQTRGYENGLKAGELKLDY